MYLTHDLQMSDLTECLLWSLMEAVCYSVIADWGTSEGFFWLLWFGQISPKGLYANGLATRVALSGASEIFNRQGLVGDPYIIGTCPKEDYRTRPVY